MNTRKNVILLVLLFLTSLGAIAQDTENVYQFRTGTELEFEPLKKLQLTVNPELRFDEGLSIDEYLLETGASYKLNKYLKLGASYRFEINPRDNKSTEHLGRYSFDASAKTKFMRFTPSLRVKYSNYSDDSSDNESFLRYKAALKYNIAKSKITPSVSAELFHQLDIGEAYKMRYSAGIDYKLSKHNSIGFDYKFDYFLNEYRNKHIFGIAFKKSF